MYGGASVASIFHEFQLKLAQFQHFVSILCHISPVAIWVCSQNATWAAMMLVT